MTEQQDHLKLAIKSIARLCQEWQRDSMAPPPSLGPVGCIALVHDSIRRFGDSYSVDDLASIAAHSIFALAYVFQKEGTNENPQEVSEDL